MGKKISIITLVLCAAFICVINLVGFFTGNETMQAPLMHFFNRTPDSYGMAPTTSLVVLLLCVAWVWNLWMDSEADLAVQKVLDTAQALRAVDDLKGIVAVVAVGKTSDVLATVEKVTQTAELKIK